MMESCFNFRLNSMESVVVEDLKKDLSADFSADSSLLEKEHLQVYLRIRPFTSAEVEHGESQECIVIEPPDTVLVNAPRTSLSARLSDKSVPQAGQQFQFSQVYGPQTTQEEIFDGTVKCLVKDVLEGGNSVVFTYGITNAGKTFTFLGPDGNGGILPRSLNVIFKSIEDHVYTQMNIKPHRCRDFIKLTKDQQDEEVANKRNIMRLFKESDSQSMTSQLSSCKSTLLEGKETVCLDVDCHTKFCVWVSFCEIYNENIHDLLEPLSNGAQKRTTLRLSQDVKGTSFVKDLKWVQVNDAEEAYKVLKLGKRNQSFSSTKLNSLSSRSHCIFSIRIIRIEGEGIPRVNTISELTLCDLAGSERCAKTLNKGDRLKEAGNINTSLLILGKCMSALKHNQRSKLQQHVPFRESKLTHYLQGFFCGRGKACMIVNVNQCASMFDETLNVLKFSALAQKVMVPNSKPLPFIPRKTVRDVSFIINNANQKSLWAKRKSSLMAWEMSLEDVQEDEGDEDIEGEDDSSVEESIMEETIQELDEESFEIDRESYNELKEKLLKEESEKLAMEAHIREEVTKEFMELFSKMESDYSERLLREKEIIEERAEKRMEIWKNLVNGNVDSKEGMDFLDGMIGSVQDDLIKIKEDAEAAQTCLSHLPDPHETITRLEKELSDLSEELCKNQELLALKNNEIEMKCHETQQANASLEEMKRNLESKTQKFQELMEMCQEKDDMISKLQLAMDMQVESATSDRHLVESIKEEILQLKQNCRCLKQDRESTHSEARKHFEQDLMLKDKEIVDLKQEQISLEVKVSKLVDDLKEQACAHDAVVSSLDTKCKENSRLVNEKEIILKEKNKWQQDAESMAKKLGGLESELREQIKEREKVSEDLEAAKALLMENNENSREKAKIIESLKRENDNLKKELEESQVLSEQGKCEKMVKECVQKSQRIQDLEQEVGRLQGLVTEEKELSGTLRRELADLKDKTQADLGHLEAERNAAAQLKRSYTHLETEVARLKNRVTDLEQQLEVLQIGASKAAKLEVQLAEKDTQLANLQKSLSEAHQKLKEEVMNGSDKIKSLSLDLQRKEDDAADLKEKLLDSKKQIQQVQKEIESMREDEKTLQRKLNDLEKMKSQLLIKVSAKEQIIQEMRSVRLFLSLIVLYVYCCSLVKPLIVDCLFFFFFVFFFFCRNKTAVQVWMKILNVTRKEQGAKSGCQDKPFSCSSWCSLCMSLLALQPSVLDSSEVSTEDGQATSRFPKPELEIQFTPLQPNKVNIKRQGGDSPVTVKITRAAKKRKSSEMDKDPVESENKKNSKRTANSRMTEDCEKVRTAGRLRQEESQSSVKAKKDGTLQKIGDFLQSSPTILGCKAKKIMELVNSKSPEAEGNTADALKSRKSKRKLYKTEISSPLDIPSHPIISLDHEDRESDHLIIKRRLRTRTAKK
uniref:Kinesin family member 20Bb n=1 Tax=Scleropages formosus TaxID=113540 RepID=A0A8C9RS43_SCLFO